MSLLCCCGLPCLCCCGDMTPGWAAWGYYIGFILEITISWVLRDYGGNALDFGPASGCSNAGNCGDLAVLRISFGSLLFFALMGILTFAVTDGDDIRLHIHTGFWPIKFLVWAGLCASTFAIPNGTFNVYLQIARVLSVFFILLQLVVLLDFIYFINEWLLERDHCQVVLIGMTGVLIVGTFVGAGFLYKYWAPQSSCSLNIFFITWTIVLFLIYGIISVSPVRIESAGLLTSAAVFAYNMYFTWSALNSEPQFYSDGSPVACVPMGNGGDQAVKIISFILAIVTIGISTINSGRSSSSFSLTGSDVESVPESGDNGKLSYRPDFFHLTFLLASAYMSMVLTGWGIPSQNQGNLGMDKGWGSVWAKISASWVCALLYIWSLIAHRVLRGRAFG